jgi:hypothetical protein
VQPTTRQEDYKRKEDEVPDDDQMAILLFNHKAGGLQKKRG